jgi:hypothetical protein
MLGLWLVAVGLSLKSIKADACGTYADGGSHSNVQLNIEACTYGAVPDGKTLLFNLPGGSVKIADCHFNDITGDWDDGIVLRIEELGASAEIVRSTFNNVKGRSGRFALYLTATTTILDTVSFEGFGSGISAIHTLHGTATVTDVTIKRFTLIDASQNWAYAIWAQSNAGLAFTRVSIEDSQVAGLIWTANDDTTVVVGFRALNTAFLKQFVRNSDNSADLFAGVFTNSTFRAESQGDPAITFHGCEFNGGGNPDAIGLLQVNAATIYVIETTFKNLAHGVWSDHLLGGRGAEFCNCAFESCATGITLALTAPIYISGTKFTGYTAGAIDLGATTAHQAFVVDGCYFAPALAGVGKAIVVVLTGAQPPLTNQAIRNSVFQAPEGASLPLPAEVTVYVQGGIASPLVVESSVVFAGDQLVSFALGSSADATQIAPSKPSGTVVIPPKVENCPGELFGNPPVAPTTPAPAAAPGVASELPEKSPVPVVAVATNSPTPVNEPAPVDPVVATKSPTPVNEPVDPVDATKSPTPVNEPVDPIDVPTKSPTTANVPVPPGGDGDGQTAPLPPAGDIGGGSSGTGGSNNAGANDGPPIAAAVGGAVAGVAAVAGIAALAFFLLKKRPKTPELLDDVPEETEPELMPTRGQLGDDHRFVSEYGLSDHQAD